MSRYRPGALAGFPWRLARDVLLGANVALLALALYVGSGEVTDGSGSITNGWLVAGGIAGTVALALAAAALPLPRLQVLQVQALALGSQVLHATGHLFRLYYVVWFYDDLLHFGLVLAMGLVAYGVGKASGLLPVRRLGPTRSGVLVWVVAVAAAGVWEIFEFVADQALGTREQDNLFDTMVDMIDGALGGLVAAWIVRRDLRLDRKAQRLADARSEELLD